MRECRTISVGENRSRHERLRDLTNRRSNRGRESPERCCQTTQIFRENGQLLGVIFTNFLTSISTEYNEDLNFNKFYWLIKLKFFFQLLQKEIIYFFGSMLRTKNPFKWDITCRILGKFNREHFVSLLLMKIQNVQGILTSISSFKLTTKLLKKYLINPL